MSDSLWPYGLYSPWNSTSQNTRVGSHSLLQEIFPTQGSNLGLPNCRWILYQLSHQGSPGILEWVGCPSSRGSSWPRNRTAVSCITGGFFTKWATREDARDWRAPAEVKGGLDWTGINQKTSNRINDPFAQSGCRTTTPQKLALGLFLHPWNPVLCDTCWDCEEERWLTACEHEKGNLLPFLWMITYMDTACFLFPTSDPFQ